MSIESGSGMGGGSGFGGRSGGNSIGSRGGAAVASRGPSFGGIREAGSFSSSKGVDSTFSSKNIFNTSPAKPQGMFTDRHMPKSSNPSLFDTSRIPSGIQADSKSQSTSKPEQRQNIQFKFPKTKESSMFDIRSLSEKKPNSATQNNVRAEKKPAVLPTLQTVKQNPDFQMIGRRADAFRPAPVEIGNKAKQPIAEVMQSRFDKKNSTTSILRKTSVPFSEKTRGEWFRSAKTVGKPATETNLSFVKSDTLSSPNVQTVPSTRPEVQTQTITKPKTDQKSAVKLSPRAERLSALLQKTNTLKTTETAQTVAPKAETQTQAKILQFPDRKTRAQPKVDTQPATKPFNRQDVQTAVRSVAQPNVEVKPTTKPNVQTTPEIQSLAKAFAKSKVETSVQNRVGTKSAPLEFPQPAAKQKEAVKVLPFAKPQTKPETKTNVQTVPQQELEQGAKTVQALVNVGVPRQQAEAKVAAILQQKFSVKAETKIQTQTTVQTEQKANEQTKIQDRTEEIKKKEDQQNGQQKPIDIVLEHDDAADKAREERVLYAARLLFFSRGKIDGKMLVMMVNDNPQSLQEQSGLVKDEKRYDGSLSEFREGLRNIGEVDLYTLQKKLKQLVAEHHAVRISDRIKTAPASSKEIEKVLWNKKAEVESAGTPA